jgi:type IV pilus assembly protein PilB
MATAMEKRLQELLIEDKIVSSEALKSALAQQKKSGESLVRTLIDMGSVSEWEMAATLGKQLNVPFITLSHYEIDRNILDSIPEDIVHKYRIVPVDRTGDVLTVALSDPSNIYLLDELRLLTKCQIVPVISFESDINEAIDRYYSNKEDLEEALKDITEEEVEESTHSSLEDLMMTGEDKDDHELSVEADDAPVVQLVNAFITDAIRKRASDVHVEPYEKMVRLRYRIDGKLHEMTPPPKKFQNAIISRLKILAELDIAEKRLPQDGRFRVRFQDKLIDFRVSSLPVAHGEKVVIRILDQSNLQVELMDLGFESKALKLFEKEIRKPWGMILITGPTGSGKSTTLYSALSTINDPAKNIITIEDPVEYQLHGINQVSAHADIGLTFAEGLRSFLRQDPDIIMVGEIRDLETAEIAVKAALTGHLVLSTLHTNDAPGTINRMTNMGVEPFLVTASVNLIVAQRLVRRICRECKEAFAPAQELLESAQIELKQGDEIFRGAGCGACNGSGYSGRVALYEVMTLTDTLRDAVIANVPASELKRMAIRQGMKTLRMSGNAKILEGRTTLEEVISNTVADEFEAKTAP